MLSFEHIAKVFSPGSAQEKCVFDDFCLAVPAGQFVSVLGSNGSGKTTLINLLCGSVTPDRGIVRMDGQDMTRVPEFKRLRRIGRVYQNPAAGTCAGMTVMENLAMAEMKGARAGLKRAVNRARREDYRALLAPLGLGLETMMDTRTGALSGGQRQALALVMTTMADIRVLVLDEHTAALDPRTAEIIMRLTDDTVRRTGLTTVMITHHLRYALEYGDRLLMLNEGRVALDAAGNDKRALRLPDVMGLYGRLHTQ